MSTHKQHQLECAYVLHTRAYRETSLLVELLSQDYGRLHAVAKGAKRLHSPFKHVLQPFTPLFISWVGRHDLVTLTHAEFKAVLPPLLPERLMSGFYMNELLMRLLADQDPHPQLFLHYEQSLNALRQANTIAPALRLFEKFLLQELGYGIAWDKDATGACIVAEQWYQLDPEQGLVPIQLSHTEVTDPSIVQGYWVQDLQHGQWRDKASLQAAKGMLRVLISSHLGGRPLKTRQLLHTH